MRYFPFFVFIESILWLYFDYAALIFHRWIHKSHISNEYWSNYFNRIVFTLFIPLNPIQSIGIHTIHICLWDGIIITMISFFYWSYVYSFAFLNLYPFCSYFVLVHILFFDFLLYFHFSFSIFLLYSLLIIFFSFSFSLFIT